MISLGFPTFAPTDRWQRYFFDLAFRSAQMSKDPSTQVGAVIVRPDKSICAMGWNGFPRGVKDAPELYEDRAEKYPRIMHAEKNAILSAKEPLVGYTLYVTPLFPCAQCAGMIIQTGIETVRFYAPRVAPERWRHDAGITFDMFRQAGVRAVYHGESPYV